MRISHRQLEACRRDPAGWVRARGGRTGGWSYGRAVTVAIFQYHEHHDVDRAAEYLRDLLHRVNRRVPERLQHAESQLRRYAGWYDSSQVVVADWQVRVSLPLGFDITMGGEVSRIDLDPSGEGYRAVLLCEAVDHRWGTELRMPLLQRAIARLYERSEKEIAIGVQTLEGDDLTQRIFGLKAIKAAELSATKLAARVNRLLPRSR